MLSLSENIYKNRLKEKFRILKERKEKAFIPYIMCGDQGLDVTEKVLFLFERIGVDAIELGVPFTDPIGDGPTIQKASQRAINAGITIKNVIKFCKNVREKGLNVPLIILSYYNPIYRYKIERFVKDAKEAGVDGVIVPDLPPEEAEDLIKYAKKEDFCTIFLLSPTTPIKRALYICERSEPFAYYVSVKGVTGAREHLFFEEVEKHIKDIKEFIDLPLCVGFGISTPEQAENMATISDGVVMGSKIVEFFQKYEGEKLLYELENFLSCIIKKVKIKLGG